MEKDMSPLYFFLHQRMVVVYFIIKYVFNTFPISHRWSGDDSNVTVKSDIKKYLQTVKNDINYYLWLHFSLQDGL
jgi:hypothetical protein